MTSSQTSDSAQASGRLDTERRRSGLAWWVPPATLVLGLYLVGTSRWGSYVTAPGLPFYIGDALYAAALIQLAVLLRRKEVDGSRLGRAPLVLQLTICLGGWSILRAILQHQADLVSLRDFAPYAYAFVAVPAFLVPVRYPNRWTAVIYGVLSFHVAWVAGLPLLPGFPWDLPVMGTDARLLVARPDFDSAICGVAMALAVRDLLQRLRKLTRARMLLLIAFITANAYGIATLETRAGLLSALLALAVVVLTRPGGSSRGPLKSAGTVAVLLAICTAVFLTPTGSRLVEGLDASSSQARGTVDVRQSVWDKVSDFVFRSPGRTAIGVGFGRNFIDESGSRQALEGDTFQNVRSPHNYVVGTLARLGVAGALLAGAVVILGWSLAIRRLREKDLGTVTAFAALLCVALPVTALLGVILESPFGALPYFWAIGVIASGRVSQNSGPEAEAVGPT